MSARRLGDQLTARAAADRALAQLTRALAERTPLREVTVAWILQVKCDGLRRRRELLALSLAEIRGGASCAHASRGVPRLIEFLEGEVATISEMLDDSATQLRALRGL